MRKFRTFDVRNGHFYVYFETLRDIYEEMATTPLPNVYDASFPDTEFTIHDHEDMARQRAVRKLVKVSAGERRDIFPDSVAVARKKREAHKAKIEEKNKVAAKVEEARIEAAKNQAAQLLQEDELGLKSEYFTSPKTKLKAPSDLEKRLSNAIAPVPIKPKPVKRIVGAVPPELESKVSIDSRYFEANLFARNLKRVKTWTLLMLRLRKSFAH